ncbi:transcriptional regulator [Blastochloris viridis]|nr:transcriptional regulator [Blastochloris viridis]
MPDERRTIQSVERALDILEVLATGADEMRLNEIARATHLNTSTCHHLISTLLDRGYVGQNPRGRTYFLGNKTLELSRSRAAMIDLVQIAMPTLRSLNQGTGETVHLDVLRGHDLTTVAKLDSQHAVRVVTDNATKAGAAHAAATGKAILAWLPETELNRILADKGLQAFTDVTIRSKDELVENLGLVRRQGFAIDREEHQPGVVGVAAAIRNHSGAVIGALSCSMPTMRADRDQLARVCDQVTAAAAALSLRLGDAGADAGDRPAPRPLPACRPSAA